MFFFEKKNQKTFAPLEAPLATGWLQGCQRSLVLSFEKELLC
jgi:hypothetical protein